MTPEEAEALDIARDLIAHGIPVFVARPARDQDGEWNPTGGVGGYVLPDKWQQATPDPAVIDAWQPGDALCAVMGHGVDMLDVDPRNDSADTFAGWAAAGLLPFSYGVATTPSGGEHHLIRSLGVGSKDGVAPGIDVKGGKPDGTSRGFGFIAPTEKLSKVTGELVAYRWTSPPMLDEITDTDDTGEWLAERIRTSRPASAPKESTPADRAEFDALAADEQARILRWLEGLKQGWANELANAASWPEGHRDENGRGWQKLTADAAYRLGSVARAPWNPWSMGDAFKVFKEVLPPQFHRTSHLSVVGEWGSQSWRKPPASFPPAKADATDEFTDASEQSFITLVGTSETPLQARRRMAATCDPVTLEEAHAVFRKWLGREYDTDALDVVLAAAAVEKMTGDPLWLLLISGSGNAKTETVQALAGAGAALCSTISSEGALLSATAKRERAKDATGGLLRELGDRGVLVVKDVTSILSMDRTARGQVLGALREVYDGSWTRATGTDGGRTLAWHGRLALVGAVTTAWDTAHSVIAAMGDRFVLCRMDSTTGRLEAGRRAIRNTGHEDAMRAELAQAVGGVLATVPEGHSVELTDDTMDALLAAADLVTLARTAVERDYQGNVTDAHAPEMPTRFAKQLAQVARGAMAVGASEAEALRLAIRCARDSVPPLRLAIVDDVAAHPGATTPDVRRRLGKPRNTVDRELQALHMLGVLECDEVEQPYGDGTRSRWHYRLADDIDPSALQYVPEMLVEVHRGIEEERKGAPEEGCETSKGSLPTNTSGTPTPSLEGEAPAIADEWRHFLDPDLCSACGESLFAHTGNTSRCRPWHATAQGGDAA